MTIITLFGNKKILSIIFLLLFCFVKNLYAIENKILIKVNNEIITTLDIKEEINYLNTLNPRLNNLSDNEIFNISNVGICSRYEFAKKILEFTNHNKKIYKFYDDNSDIKRPIFSALSTKKISKLLNFKINKWEDGLKLMIKEMKL